MDENHGNGDTGRRVRAKSLQGVQQQPQVIEQPRLGLHGEVARGQFVHAAAEIGQYPRGPLVGTVTGTPGHEADIPGYTAKPLPPITDRLPANQSDEQIPVLAAESGDEVQAIKARHRAKDLGQRVQVGVGTARNQTENRLPLHVDA